MFTFTSWSNLLYLIVDKCTVVANLGEQNFMQLTTDRKSEPNMLQIVVNLFLQDLPHLLVRCNLLSICTVEVVDTNQHLSNFPSKV